ncbi:MAG: hypothetical protein NXI20_18245 [bacterium]|nr:hypothetical protein [bacterium]
MKKLLLLILILPFGLHAQIYKQELSFPGSGDKTMPLGRYQVGTAVHVLFQVDGGWAQDGGVYHIASDWNGTPRIIYRGESSISTRLKFYGYVDPASAGYAFIWATWDNQSPSESYSNTAKFTISSNGHFDANNHGTFSSATELPSVLVVQSNSQNVGIGTTDTFGHKLAVNGSIGCKEVKVETTSAWPDYVFEDGYDLISLEAIESFINENGHLPNIPSAAEVEENKGIELGEMNAKLLEKIEELTLYMIELKKENQSLKNRIEKIESSVEK